MTEVKSEYKTIIFKKDISGFAEIILNQPDRHNALSPLMIEELNITFNTIFKNIMFKTHLPLAKWEHIIQPQPEIHSGVFFKPYTCTS